MSDKNIFSLAGLVSIIILGLANGYLKSNDDELKIEHDKYCELVIMWESDADTGLEPNNSSGHPNYKGVSCAE